MQLLITTSKNQKLARRARDVKCSNKAFHQLVNNSQLWGSFLLKFKNQMKTKLFDFLCLLINHNAIKLLFSPSFPQPFWEIGEFSVKKYFTDHWKANTIQLFVAIKVDFSSPFFFCTHRSKGEFSRDYLINVGTYLFAYH